MDSATIKYELERRGLTQTDVANLLGIKDPSVSAVISRRHRSELVERGIAAAIDRPPHEVWPGWYATDGQRIRKRRSEPSHVSVEAIQRTAKQFAERPRRAA